MANSDLVNLKSLLNFINNPEKGKRALSTYFGVALAGDDSFNFEKSDVDNANKFSNFFLLVGLMANYNSPHRNKTLAFTRKNKSETFSLNEFRELYAAVCYCVVKGYDSINFSTLHVVLETNGELPLSVVERQQNIKISPNTVNHLSRLLDQNLDAVVENTNNYCVDLVALKESCDKYAQQCLGAFHLRDLQTMVSAKMSPQEYSLRLKRMYSEAILLGGESKVQFRDVDSIIRDIENGIMYRDLPMPEDLMCRWISRGKYSDMGLPCYTLIGGSSGHGKTTLGLVLGFMYALQGIDFVCVSAEESVHAMQQKFVAMALNKPYHYIRSLSQEDYISALKSYKSLPVSKHIHLIEGFGDRQFWETAALLEQFLDDVPKNGQDIYVLIDNLQMYNKGDAYSNHLAISQWCLDMGTLSVRRGCPMHIVLLVQFKNLLQYSAIRYDTINAIAGDTQVARDAEMIIAIARDLDTHKHTMLIGKDRVHAGIIFPDPLPYVVDETLRGQFSYSAVRD